MFQVLAITFPVFGAIVVGYALTARRLFSGADMRVLGRYVLNVALPALLFAAVAQSDLGLILHPGYLAAFLLGGFATMGAAFVLFTLSGTGPARRAIAVLGAAVPNSAFIGYPVMRLVFPDEASRILTLNFIAENFLLIPLAFVLLEVSRPAAVRPLAAILRDVARRVLLQPFVLALLAGLAVTLLGLPVPGPVLRLLEILAASASALSLVVIGGTLYGMPMRGSRALAAGIAAAKLVLHPALVALAGLAVTALGIGLPPQMWAAAVLSAAMPMLGIYAILAQPFGHDGVASLALLMATAGAFVTLTVLLAAFV